jgi:hypothetical protein
MASSGNFCTWNPLGAHGGGTTDFGTLSGGNLLCTLGDTVFGNFGVTSGKWYWEWCMTGSAWDGGPGWANQQVNTQAELGYNSPSSATGAQIVYMYCSNGSTNWHIISDAPKSASSGTTVDYSTALAQDDIIGICADFDNDKWYMSINGSFTNMRSGQNPADGSNPLCSASGGGGTVTIARTAGYVWYPAIGNWAAASRPSTVNFGQDSTFGGEITAGGNADGNGFGDFKYAPPTGFLALCTGNLSVSDDIDPAQTDDEYPAKNFNTVLFTGNSSTNAVTGLGFKPDLIWGFTRDGTQDKRMIDSTRGGASKIVSNATNDEVTGTTVISAFGTDGFTANGGQFNNDNGKACGAWCWKGTGGTTASNSDGDITSTIQANTNAGFSIVKFTSNNTANQEIGHGLGAVPRFILVKPLTGGGWSWWVYHYNNGTLGYLKLNDSDAFSSGTAGFGAHPSSSVFTMGAVGNSMPNNTSTEVISYVWSDVEGMQKFGIYEGNGNVDGAFIYTGFRPRMLFVKDRDRSENWVTFDSARNTFNSVDKGVFWNSDAVETTGSGSGFDVDFLSNGFKMRCTHDNLNGSSTYIYGAWGDVPFKYNNSL